MSTSITKVYAVIENGIVSNKIIADDKFVAKFYPDSVDLTNFEFHPNIGDSWDGISFTPKPEIVNENFPQ